jgi:hypothetical protein
MLVRRLRPGCGVSTCSRHEAPPTSISGHPYQSGDTVQIDIHCEER